MEQNLNEELMKSVLAELKAMRAERTQTADEYCSETTTNLVTSLVQVQKEMGAAHKDSTNPRFRSKYASLNSVIETAKPHLLNHDIALIQRVTQKDDKSYLVTRLAHTSGEWMESSLVIPTEAQTAQSVGSALTYYKRYGLAAMIGLITSDEVEDDGNAIQNAQEEAARAAERRKLISESQLVTLRNALKGDVEFTKAFLDQAQLAKLSDLTVKRFDGALEWIAQNTPEPQEAE